MIATSKLFVQSRICFFLFQGIFSSKKGWDSKKKTFYLEKDAVLWKNFILVKHQTGILTKKKYSGGLRTVLKRENQKKREKNPDQMLPPGSYKKPYF